MSVSIKRCADIVLSSKRLSFLLVVLAGFLLLSGAAHAQAQITYLKSWGTLGSGNGQFGYLAGISVSPSGDVFVADSGNCRIQKFDSQGNFLMKFGSQGSGQDQFLDPRGVAAAADGTIYVADLDGWFLNSGVKYFDATGVYVGSMGYGFLAGPVSVAVNQNKDVYVADNERTTIVKFPSGGGSIEFGISGGCDPTGLAVAPNGNIYVADTINHRVVYISPTGDYLGSYTSGISSANAVAVGRNSAVYVSDYANNRIVKFPSSGSSTTFGISGSGPGQFDNPAGVAVSSTGEIYVADQNNVRVEKWFDLDAWVSGSPHLDDAYVGTGQMLGQSLTLGSTKGLLVDHVLAVLPGGELIHQGTNITASYFQNHGWTYVGPSSDLDADYTMTNEASATLSVDGTINVNSFSNSGAFLRNDGVMLINSYAQVNSNASVSNYNYIRLSNGEMWITGANDQGIPYTIDNEFGAILEGTGSIISTVNNFGIINAAAGSIGTLHVDGINNYGEINIPAGGHLTFGTVYNYATINITGGSAEANTVLMNYADGVISGKGSLLRVDNSGLVHATESQLTLWWPYGNRASGEFLIDSGATLRTVGSFSNDGLIQLTGTSAVLSGDDIVNTGTIQGQGRITNTVTNSGTIRADGGQLTLAGTLFVDTGGSGWSTIECPAGATVFVSQGLLSNWFSCQIALSGGAFDNDNHGLFNYGSIVGHGTFRSGGLVNASGGPGSSGVIHFADGATNVFGSVENTSHATFLQEGSSSTLTTFYGFVTNDPGGTFQVIGGTVRFLGGVSGVSMSNAGDLELDAAGQIVATSAITNNDTFLVQGGTHTLNTINGTGEMELSDAANVTVTSLVQNTLTLDPGATLTIKALPGGPTAGDQSLSPVSEPSAWAMLIAAALGLGLCRRRMMR